MTSKKKTGFRHLEQPLNIDLKKAFDQVQAAEKAGNLNPDDKKESDKLKKRLE